MKDKMFFRFVSTFLLFLVLPMGQIMAEILIPNPCRVGQRQLLIAVYYFHTYKMHVKLQILIKGTIYLFLTRCTQPRNHSYNSARVEFNQS